MLFLLLSIISLSDAAEVPPPAEVPADPVLEMPPPPKARLGCVNRLLATSGALTAGGLAMLGTGIAQADQGRPWEPWAIGGGVFTAGGLSVLVNLGPLVLRRDTKNNLQC